MAGNSTIPFPAGFSQYIEDIGGGIMMPVRKPHAGALGVDDSSGAFSLGPCGGPTNTTYLAADIDPNGVVVLTGPSTVYAVAVNQSSGGTLFAFLYDATSVQPVNAKPLINAGSIANNGVSILSVGHPIYGLPFSTGVVFQLSAVTSQFSPSGSTLARGYVIHT